MLLPEPLWPTIARNSPWRTLEAHAAEHGHFDRSLAVALVQVDGAQLVAVIDSRGDARPKSRPCFAADGTSDPCARKPPVHGGC